MHNPRAFALWLVAKVGIVSVGVSTGGSSGATLDKVAQHIAARSHLFEFWAHQLVLVFGDTSCVWPGGTRETPPTLVSGHALHPKSQDRRRCTGCACHFRSVAVPTSSAAAAVVSVGSVSISEIV